MDRPGETGQRIQMLKEELKRPQTETKAKAYAEYLKEKALLEK